MNERDILQDERDVAYFFGVLDTLVRQRNRGTGFTTPAGVVRRDVDAGEFMLMQIVPESANTIHDVTQLRFKHRDTRNYVHVDMAGDEWRLVVFWL